MKAAFSLKQELRRKLFHLSGLIIPLSYLWLTKQQALFILVPFASVVLICDVLRQKTELFNRIVEKMFGALLRPEERKQGWCFCGATPFFLSSALCIFLFPKAVAVAALFVLIAGDAAAALAGKKWGKTPLGHTGKTLEGMLGFVAAAFVVLVAGVAMGILPSGQFFFIIPALLAAAVTEVISPRLYINDNFSIPLVYGGVFTLLSGGS